MAMAEMLTIVLMIKKTQQCRVLLLVMPPSLVVEVHIETNQVSVIQLTCKNGNSIIITRPSNDLCRTVVMKC